MPQCSRVRSGATEQRSFALARSRHYRETALLQLPLPTAKKGTRMGAFLVVDGGVDIAETPQAGPPRQSVALRVRQVTRRVITTPQCSHVRSGATEQRSFALARSRHYRETVFLQLPLPVTKKRHLKRYRFLVVGRGRFELPKSETSDLQSDPFGHSGIFPNMKLGCAGRAAVGSGAGDWNRTHNLLITNQLLCQLSYTSTVGASGRNRTTDTGIFSPLLYRLSYRGILKPAWQPTYAIKQAFSKEWRPGTVSNRRPPA